MTVRATVRKPAPASCVAFGLRLRTLRAALSKTQDEFASDIGIAVKTVKNYEGGHRDPPASLVARVCIKFAVDPAWLLLGDAARPMFQSTTREGA